MPWKKCQGVFASLWEVFPRDKGADKSTFVLTPIKTPIETIPLCRPLSYIAKMQRGSYTKFFLTLALIMDIVGLLLFFIGIFAPLSFWDFFVISGPLLIFLSLVLWIFWYIGNLTVSEEELNLVKPDILWCPRTEMEMSYGHPKWSVGALKTLVHSSDTLIPLGNVSVASGKSLVYVRIRFHQKVCLTHNNHGLDLGWQSL